jgi:hypothetical protein
VLIKRFQSRPETVHLAARAGREPTHFLPLQGQPDGEGVEDIGGRHRHRPQPEGALGGQQTVHELLPRLVETPKRFQSVRVQQRRYAAAEHGGVHGGRKERPCGRS